MASQLPYRPPSFSAGDTAPPWMRRQQTPTMGQPNAPDPFMPRTGGVNTVTAPQVTQGGMPPGGMTDAAGNPVNAYPGGSSGGMQKTYALPPPPPTNTGPRVVLPPVDTVPPPPPPTDSSSPYDLRSTEGETFATFYKPQQDAAMERYRAARQAGDPNAMANWRAELDSFKAPISSRGGGGEIPPPNLNDNSRPGGALYNGPGQTTGDGFGAGNRPTPPPPSTPGGAPPGGDGWYMDDAARDFDRRQDAARKPPGGFGPNGPYQDQASLDFQRRLDAQRKPGGGSIDLGNQAPPGLDPNQRGDPFAPSTGPGDPSADIRNELGRRLGLPGNPGSRGPDVMRPPPDVQTDPALPDINTDFGGEAGRGADAAYRGATQFLDKDFGTARAALETQLTNQGLQPGSEAWNNAVSMMERTQNATRQNAAFQAQGVGHQQAGDLLQRALQSRGQLFGEGESRRNRELSRYGIDRSADTSRYNTDAGINMGRYNTDTSAELARRRLGLDSSSQDFNQLMQLIASSRGGVNMPNFGPPTTLDVGGANSIASANRNAQLGRDASDRSALAGLGGSFLSGIDWASLFGGG